jgi:putative hydrolase of the HAD superfamily
VLTEEAWHAFLATLLPEQATAAQELMRQSNAGLITYDDFIHGVGEVTGQKQSTIEMLLRNEQAKNLVLLDYIKQLKGRGYRIGMLSNVANNWIRDHFLTMSEQELFDELVFSYEVGMTKPDPRIFMLACERLRVGPHEAVLVDDIDRFVDAAREEGLYGIVYENFHQMKHDLEKLLNPQH